MKYLKYMLIAGLAVIFLAGCANNQNNTSSTHEQVTIENYAIDENGTATPATENFEEVPQRIFAGTQGAAELLAKLGLADKIVGQAAIFGDFEPSVADILADVPITTRQYPSKEQLVSTSPDIVISRAVSFANNDWGHGTTADIQSLGINTYVLATTVTGAKFDTIYTDIANLGKIFSIEDKAQAFAQELKAKEASIAEKMAQVDNEKTFAYLSTVERNNLTVYSASNETFFNDSLSRLNLKNAFADSEALDIGIEQLVATNPDVLFITTYEGGPSAEETKDFLLNNPALANMDAIKNKQVFVLPFHTFWNNSYAILDGLESLGRELYPNQFK